MARLDPFVATRYDKTRVEPDAVVAPPYDVVGPALRAELAGRSPYNAIYVDLPAPDEAAGLDAYENAAAIFRAWRDAGVVKDDEQPGFYVYKMTFQDDEGHPRAMTGMLCALGLDLEGAGDVRPHEMTMPKDRQDRLSLLSATRLNTSPIWALSLAKGLTGACRDALESSGEAPWRATDDDGVVHELWQVTDKARIEEISSIGSSAQVLLADGHHRYQTACNYARQCREENGGEPGPYDLVLAFVVELSEEELSIRAIHRLVKDVPAEVLLEAVARWYRIEVAPGDLGEVPASGAPGLIAMLDRDGYKLLYPLPALAETAADDLDSSRLQVVLESLPRHEVSYEPGWPEATAAVRDGRATAAFFLRPVPVASIEAVAETGRLMPPKSTYFQPKPRSGMAFRFLG